MANLQKEIAYKRRQISTHEEDLASLYCDLGRLGIEGGGEARSVALIEQRRRYSEVLEEWERAVHSREQIAGYIRQIEDRSRKIGEIEADIKALGQQEEEIYSRLGAMAWEAYGFGTLPPRSRELCDPIFASHAQRIQTLNAQAMNRRGTLARRLALIRLHRLRSRFASLLLNAGRSLAAAGWEGDLDLARSSGLAESLASVRTRRLDLDEELALHQSAMAKLKSEEVSAPKAKLAESEELASRLEEECEIEGGEYGRLLYEQEIRSEEEGWEGLVNQIRLHRNRIIALEQEIHSLGNQVKAEELTAQIEVEMRRIAHLRSSMESAHRQIVQLDGSIEEKRRQIEVLLSRTGEITDG